jgi:serine/threonine-protein kinase
MAIPKLACDRERLRQSLDDRLSEQQEEVLMQHLAECPACQQELETLAAEQAEWSRVAEVLRREAAARISSVGAAGTRESACDSPVDFAVAFLEPSSLPGALGRLGDVDILEVIGHGGMGIVLKGFQQELHRPVAVKVLAPHLAASGAARQRFAREARATAVVVHPNVMPVLTVHSSGKLPYLVMPYVPCESLQQRLDRQGWLETLDIVRIAWQVACGLAAAHAQGLVHRDIKPANMLLEKGVDRVLLTDFGLARAVDDASLTRTGVIAGTPQYMSPEQARGEAVDHRSDLFSLGSVMYAMCTGRVPFRAETSYGILRRITDTEPRPIREINPGIPEWLVTIVAKLHAKDPAGRFASADELAKLLEQCLAHVQQPTAVPLPDAIAATELASAGARLTATPMPLSCSRSRRPLLIGSFFAGLLVLAAVAGIAIRIHQEDGNERSKSPAESVVSDAPSITENAARGQTTLSAWQDGVVAQIRDLDEATDQLETSARQLWDHPTSSARSNDPTHAIQPSNQQVTK